MSMMELSKLPDDQLLKASTNAMSRSRELEKKADPLFWFALPFVAVIIISDVTWMMITSAVIMIGLLVAFVFINARSMGWINYSLRVLDVSIQRSKDEILKMIAETDAQIAKEEAKKLSTGTPKKAKK